MVTETTGAKVPATTMAVVVDAAVAVAAAETRTTATVEAAETTMAAKAGTRTIRTGRSPAAKVADKSVGAVVVGAVAVEEMAEATVAGTTTQLQ